MPCFGVYRVSKKWTFGVIHNGSLNWKQIHALSHFDHHCFQLNWDFAIAFFPTLWEWSFKKASTHILVDETIVLSQVGKKDLKCPASMPTQRWCPHFDKKKHKWFVKFDIYLSKGDRFCIFSSRRRGDCFRLPGWNCQGVSIIHPCHHHHHGAIFIIVIIIIMLQVFRVPSDLFSGNPMEKNLDTPLVSLPEQARRIETVIMILPLWSVDFYREMQLRKLVCKNFPPEVDFQVSWHPTADLVLASSSG